MYNVIWFLCDADVPPDDKDIIIISYGETNIADKHVEIGDNDYIRWFGQYQKGKYIVTSFDDEGTYELNLKPICWCYPPKIPFSKP